MIAARLETYAVQRLNSVYRFVSLSSVPTLFAIAAVGFRARGDFWPHLGIRDGKWKLMVNQKLKQTELYDIEADWAEKNDLSKQFSDITKELTDKVLAWKETLPLSPPSHCLSEFRKK